MIRIAFLITSKGWGGLEMNTIKLGQEFVKLNYEVLFIVAENTRLHNEAKAIFNSVTAINPPGKYFDYKNALSLSRLLKKENINHVVITNNRDIDLLAITKRWFCKNLKIIYQQQMQIGVNKRDIIHTMRYKSLRYWISPLPYLKEEVLAKTKFPEKKIKVIPLGINVNNFIERSYTKEEALQKLSIEPSDAALIGIIGRIDRKKGQLFLIEAISELIERKLKIELLIFGSPTINDSDGQQYFTEIKDLIAAKKMENIVHIKSYDKDVKMFYNAIDIFALASYSETFGMVTVEAMASKIPIVAGNTGGTPEILDNGKLGLLYDYDNINSFCEKVEWILRHKKEAEAMAELAQREAGKKYSETNIAKQISDLMV